MKGSRRQKKAPQGNATTIYLLCQNLRDRSNDEEIGSGCITAGLVTGAADLAALGDEDTPPLRENLGAVEQLCSGKPPFLLPFACRCPEHPRKGKASKE